MQLEQSKVQFEGSQPADQAPAELTVTGLRPEKSHDPYLRSFIGLNGRIGIFGTSADPIHHGHIAAAQAVARSLALDAMVIIPVYQNPMKQQVPGASGIQRLMMVRDALLDHPGLFVSPIEVLKGRPCYSVEILEQIRQELHADAKLFFVMGSDNLIALHKWKNVDRLFELAAPVVISRNAKSKSQAIEEIKNQQKLSTAQISQLAANYLEVKLPDISSTEVRLAIASGNNVNSDLVNSDLPEAVTEFILKHQLYKSKS